MEGKKKPKKSQKKRSKKAAKQRVWDKTVDMALETGSRIALMFAESRFFPNGRGTKGKAA